MSKFITEDDIWGIRKAVRGIWESSKKPVATWYIDESYKNDKNADFFYNVFYNQVVPEAWMETRATVARHIDEIRSLAESEFVDKVWYSRNGQMSSMNLCVNGSGDFQNRQFWQSIESGEVILPTYIEIQEEQQRWQSHPQYNKERGFSEPIREELIQIRIHK